MPTAKLRVRKRASGSIGAGVRASWRTNQASRATPPSSGPATTGSPQPRAGCSVSATTTPARPSAHSAAPATSTAPPSPRSASRHRAAQQHERDQHERDVEVEDPAPRERVDQDAAAQRAGHEGHTGPADPAADRRAALLGREGDRDEGEARGDEQRAGHALQRPRGDQRPGGRRQRAQQRGDAEAGEPRLEDPAAAEHVAQRAAHEQQRAEREQVGLHHPLLRGQPGAQVLPQGRQRDVDHRLVQERDP